MIDTFPPGTASASIPRGPAFDLDLATFLPSFNVRSCSVRHRLSDHPLFALPHLLALAKRMPSKYVRINSGNVPASTIPADIPGPAQSIEESFERIHDCETRIMLKGIEHDEEYGTFLRACLAEIEALGHPVTKAIVAREGYVFLSSPNMITPYHMDPEINFLLQIRGKKTFFVLSGADKELLSEEAIERFYTGKHESLTFPEKAREKAVPFDMLPGDGVHIPVNHPHWVETYGDVAISFALTLQTAATKRRGSIYAVNYHLRRAGLRPTPFGHSPFRDSIKYHGYRLWSYLNHCFPRRRNKKHDH